MKIYIAYKFQDADKLVLRELLEEVSEILESSGHKTFILFRDVRKWQNIEIPVDKMMGEMFANIKKTDALLAIIQSNQKSEGLLLEAGFAKALGKKLIIAIKKGVNLRCLKSIADTLIEFDNMDDLKQKLRARPSF